MCVRVGPRSQTRESRVRCGHSVVGLSHQTDSDTVTNSGHRSAARSTARGAARPRAEGRGRGCRPVSCVSCHRKKRNKGLASYLHRACTDHARWCTCTGLIVRTTLPLASAKWHVRELCELNHEDNSKIRVVLERSLLNNPWGGCKDGVWEVVPYPNPASPLPFQTQNQKTSVTTLGPPLAPHVHWLK